MKSRSHILHRLLPLYLPFFLLSVASAILVYLGVLTIARRFIAESLLTHPVGTDGYIVRVKSAEGAAQVAAYFWFLLAQGAFYKIYAETWRYRAYRRSGPHVAHMISSLYCLAVTAVGFSGILLWTWRITTQH